MFEYFFLLLICLVVDQRKSKRRNVKDISVLMLGFIAFVVI